MTDTLVLVAPMSAGAPPEWAGARWVGVVDDADVDAVRGAVVLAGAQDHRHARLLVRHDGRPRGFVDLPVRGGRVDPGELRAGVAALPVADPGVPAAALSITVVICTRDRPDQLASALASVLALDHPAFEVIVVDNAPSDASTRELVERITPPPGRGLRHVTEPTPGLSNARNRGLRHATTDVVAFTDDDVVVDPGWLRGILAGFAAGSDVDCVTGLVPSGELRTPVQEHFDRRVGWAASCRPRVFSLARPPTDVALFPFGVGVYGTGANFAVRRSAAFALGGFDEALGVGSPTGGGEDIDLFVRVIMSGRSLAYEPSAVVWHRHRADRADLARQAVGYGTGLGAWLTKVALDRRLAVLALRRAVAAVRRLRDLGAGAAGAPAHVEPGLRADLSAVARAERAAVLRGPGRYLRSRRQGRRARPLDGVVPAVSAAAITPVPDAPVLPARPRTGLRVTG